MGAELETSSTIFLLGAGASVEAGCPAVQQLTSEFPQWAGQAGVPNRSVQAYRWLLDRLGQVPAVKEGQRVIDIELVLEALGRLSERERDPLAGFVKERGGWVAQLQGFEAQLPELGTRIREYIRQRCEVSGEAVEYLYPLVDYSEVASLDVFTLNYDYSVELACQRRRTPYTDGFTLEWDPREFDNPSYRIRLHKLHGSLLWYETRESPGLVKIPIAREPGQNIRFIGAADVSASLVYPAVPKEQHVEPYSTLMSRFRAALRNARILVAIGCSFRDRYIKEVVAEALDRNRDLRLVVVDPDAAHVLTRSDGMLQGALTFARSASRVHVIGRSTKTALDGGWLMGRLRALRDADAELADSQRDWLEASRGQKFARVGRVLPRLMEARDVGTIMRLARSDEPFWRDVLTSNAISERNSNLELTSLLVALACVPERAADLVPNATRVLERHARHAVYGFDALQAFRSDCPTYHTTEEASAAFNTLAWTTNEARRAVEELEPMLKWHAETGFAIVCSEIVQDLQALACFYEAGAAESQPVRSVSRLTAASRPHVFVSVAVEPMRALAQRIEAVDSLPCLRSMRLLHDRLARSA